MTATRRRDLADPNHPYHRAPRGVWFYAGTPETDGRYPCMCFGRKACTNRCPCSGRTDTESMPAMCCSRRRIDEGNGATVAECRDAKEAA